MNLPSRIKLNQKHKGEKGSVTLFVLIAMLFFLIIGMMIFIINMNAETSQKRDVEKIKSEYRSNTNDTYLDTMYQEAKQRQLGKFVIKVIDSYKEIYNSGEWINGANADRLPLTIDANWPAGVACVEIVDHTGVGIRVNSEKALEDVVFGKENTQEREGQYQITAKVDNVPDTVIYVYIDLTAPTASITPNGGTVWKGTEEETIQAQDASNVITLTASDNVSGVKEIQYIINNSSETPAADAEWQTYNENSKPTINNTQENGAYYIHVRAIDNAGNISEVSNSEPYFVKDANYKITTGSDIRYADTLADAITKAKEASTTTESTIQVLRAVNDNSEATIDKTITLDTNGKTLTMANTIIVAKNKTATFVDTAETKGKLERTTGNLITNNGTVKVGTQNSTNGAILESKDCVIYGASGDVEVNSGKLNVTGKGQWTTNYTTIWAKNITIRGGEVTNDYVNFGIIGLNNINITGGKVNGKHCGIHNGSSGGTLNISGNTEITGKDAGIMGYSVGATINISGESKITSEGEAINIYANSTTINITGGTISGSVGIYSRAESSGHNITISGGTITGETKGIVLTGANSTLTIGNNQNALDRTSPVITGTNGYSVEITGATSTFNFYDGKLVGGTKALASEEKRTFFGREMSFNLANDTTANFLTETEGNATRRYLPYTRENSETHKFETVLEKEVKVTFNKNAEDATCTETERNVLTNVEYKELAGNANDESVTYSNLPRQTGLDNETDSKIDRTGYTFKGWNGKNLLNPNDLINDKNIASNEDGLISAVNKTGDSRTWSYENSNFKMSLPAGTYTLSLDFTKQTISAYSLLRIYDENGNYIKFNLALNDVQYQMTTFTLNKETNIGIELKLYDAEVYMQLEEGSTATAYEPYFVTDDTLVTKDTDHTLTAIWEANKYTVHFDGDGATGGTMADQSFEYDEEKALTQNAFTREHTVTYDGNEGTASKANDTATYTFTNWGNKDILGYDLDMSVGNVRQDNIIGNENGYKTLTNTTGSNTQKDFARWTILPTFNPGDKYKVTFYAKGTRGALGADLGIFFYGATDYLQCTKVECSNGAGNTRADGYMGLLLTDKWTKYTVTWTLGSNGDGNVNKYLMFRVYSEANASIYGVRFEKLENEEHADQEVVSNLTSDPNGTVTLYAVWTPHEVTLPSATREGYIFNGWYDATTGGNKIGNAGDKYIPEANITLHAQWRQVHYTVSVGEEILPAETLAEAVGLAEERITGSVTTATITSLMNYADSSTVTISKNITIDTNGHEITMANTITVDANTTATFVDTATTKGKLIRTAGKLITNSGTVKIGTNNTDGTDMDSVDRVVSGGDVEVNSGILNLTGAGELDTNFAVISAVNITVNGGQIINDYKHYGLLTYAQASVIDLNGGMIRAQGCGINSYATLNMSGTTQINGETGIITYNNTTFNITGGTINASNNGIYNSKNGTINVSGGTITGGTHGIYNAANGTINVSGATTSITGTSSQGIRGYTGNVTISGGTIHGNTHGISVNADTLNSGSILMTGGTVESAYYGLLAAGNSTITMGTNDGTVSKETPEVISNATSGDYNGVYRNTTATFNFYDGKVTCYTEHSLNAAETSKPDGYQVVKRTDNGRETAVLEKELTVTFEPNPGNTTGATVNPTSKTVLTNTAYGELPTPTKTGYSFNGWRTGKNQFNESKYTRLEDYDLTDNSYKVAKISLKPNTAYKVSIKNYNGYNGRGKGYLLINSTAGHIYSGNWIAVAHVSTGSGYQEGEEQYFTTGNDGVLNIGYYNDMTQENLDYIWANTDVQIEEGSTATAYEPYYITATTTVVREDNHTLYADWTANPYTVTADAMGGTIPSTDGWTNAAGNSSATKTVYYDSTYGTLPTPTRDGYTFLGWYKENTFVNRVETTTQVTTDSDHTIYAYWTNFTLSKNPIYMNKTTTSIALIAPEGTSGATVTYTGNNIGELTFESENANVATVQVNADNTQAAIATAGGAQTGDTTRIIIKDKTSGLLLGELNVIIDTELPTWMVRLLSIE